MVSTLNSAPLAPPMRFRLAAVALSCLEHEKKTFFSYLENSRSGGGSQGRPKGAAPAVGAKRRAFTDDRSGGYRASARRDAHSPRSFAFYTLTRVNRKVAIWQPRFHEFYP